MRTSFLGLWAALSLCAGIASAQEEEYVILTGGQAGTYFNQFGPRIEEVLATRRFAHQVVSTAGTGENFDRVCANPSNVGIGQADVLPTLMAGNPTCQVEIVNTIASECVFGATNVPELQNLDQVAEISFNLRIAVPKTGSGSWLTWENMVSKMPLLGDAQIIEVADSAAGIELVRQGEADIAMFVAFPDPENAIFRATNEAELTFLDMSSFDLLQQQVGETYLYDRVEVTVANAGWTFWEGSTSVETACTKVVIFTGSPTSPNLPRGQRFQESLINLLASADPATFRPDVPWMTAIMNDVANTSRDRMMQAAEAAKEFANENIININ
jgi:hypothetical protein